MLSIDQYIDILKNPNTTVTIAQQTCPIKIENYRAIYLPDLDASPECIMHSVTYSNISNSKIVAVRFGIAAFDAFNRFMEKFSGISIEDLGPGARDTSEWHHTSYAPWLFKTYGVGVIYLDAVRFEDGLFWYSDSEQVLLEMQKIEKELTKDDLKDKKGKR